MQQQWTAAGRKALCVAVEREACRLIYLDDMESVVIRARFEGAEVGKWFCANKKGTFDQIEEAEAPKVKVTRRREHSDVTLKVLLPIFFAPPFEQVGYKLKSGPVDGGDFRVFYSPLLDGGKPIYGFDGFNNSLIEPGTLYDAFLALTFEENGLPQWRLDSYNDVSIDSFVKTNSNALFCDHYKFGYVIQLVADKHMAYILCLEDGKLALASTTTQNGTVLPVGTFVKFLCGEVNCFVQPVSMALDCTPTPPSIVVNSDHPRPPYHLRVLDEPNKLFELRFPITEGILSTPNVGAICIDALGVLVDSDAQFRGQLPRYRIGQLITVQVRLILGPERQSPLWYFMKVVEDGEILFAETGNGIEYDQFVGIDGNVKYRKSDREERSRKNGCAFMLIDEAEEGEECEVNEEDGKVLSHNQQLTDDQHKANNQNGNIKSEEQNGDLNVADGGFGRSRWAMRKRFTTKIEERNCVEESLNASISAQSSIGSGGSEKGDISLTNVNDQSMAEQDVFNNTNKIEEGIALFTQMRSYEWFLLLYDERINKFTDWCYTLIKSLPLDRCRIDAPVAGSWFRICYAFSDTHTMHRPQKQIVITMMRNVEHNINLPMDQVHPDNKRVWDMVLRGNIDGLTREVIGKSNTTVSCTDVFSRSSSVTIGSNNIESHWRSEVKLNGDELTANNGVFRSRNRSSLTSIESTSPRLRASSSVSNYSMRDERYFCVKTEMAGIVVGIPSKGNENTYKVWPFCTNEPTPQELVLNTECKLQLGTWIRFGIECYHHGVIHDCHELAPWLKTDIREGEGQTSKVCLECDVVISRNFGKLPEAEIWTARFKPTDPKTPFIRKLVPSTDLVIHLEKFRGRPKVFVRSEYVRKFDRDGRTIGYWQIVALL